MARRWTNGNDGPHTLEKLLLVFAAGVFVVLWLAGQWWAAGR